MPLYMPVEGDEFSIGMPSYVGRRDEFSIGMPSFAGRRGRI
jgi:hypothetical protein